MRFANPSTLSRGQNPQNRERGFLETNWKCPKRHPPKGHPQNLLAFYSNFLNFPRILLEFTRISLEFYWNFTGILITYLKLIFSWCPLGGCPLGSSKPNMTGRRFHRTTEAIPRRSWKSLKTPLLPGLLKQAQKKGTQRCARGTTRYFLHYINSVQTRCIVKGEAQKSPLFWRFSGGF